MSTIRSRFWRGGVCNALIFRKSDLPTDRSKWQPLFAAAMGSPDPYGRQLNGMGGGISSLSKVCIVSPSTRDDADVDFEFVQVVIDDGSLDLASNCGNMTAAVGPFALDEGLLNSCDNRPDPTTNHASIRIYNTNTKKIIISSFPVKGSPPKFVPQGNYRMDGVPGTASQISLSFQSPGGTQTGRVLPTGNGTTFMTVTDRKGRNITASILDVANPGVYVDGNDLGISADVTPAELDQQKDTMALMETVRREAAERMGMDPDTASVPKVVVLFKPTDKEVSRGTNIKCLPLSMGQAHKAIPLTLALNLGTACKVQGTLASKLARNMRQDEKVIIQHPSGMIEVGVEISGEDVLSASLFSTARLLMKGEVNVE
ncbi:methylitaconate delta2-delta3-isomerase [Trichoderma arundinaceum]|uniref:Methylitaconate delta2-delta3-isomerase n=1 Tax=Trichoderma arundinaceum TaxID=490622 RepID=A0A395NKE8_TRIAR|nr:methylitaconate delta2-delta3-isomerase [Trichoderma arundinaceum]